MKAIRTIAFLTFREAIRNKILYLLFFFSMFLILFSLVIGHLTVGDQTKIIKDIGLGAIHFFGVMITIFIGIGLLFREMEKRTIFLILSKPVERYQFLLGKFFGLALTLLVALVTLGLVFWGVLLLKHNAVQGLFFAFLLTYLEWLLIAGIAILFSTFSTPLLSSMMTFACFLAGHLTESFHLLQARVHSVAGNALLSILFYILPNLELFNIRAQVVHSVAIPIELLLQTFLYWILYLGAILFLSISIFQRKDFV
jgi:ABC-type transport system involved in multi-copper enzyme maturation permease subunit